MPELFPDILTFVLAALVMAGAQLVYATVGFGAGMFAVVLLAFLLPDLTGTIAMLTLLTLVTEVWVLLHTWRHMQLRLLLGLLPTMAGGLWLGTRLLVTGDVSSLKRFLGVVVASAGLWFLYGAWRHSRKREEALQNPLLQESLKPKRDCPLPDGRGAVLKRGSFWMNALSLPVGLASGTLTGLFGAGGPPVIIYLRGFGPDKAAFRATLLWFFLSCSLTRIPLYVHEGVLTADRAMAALWLLPASIAGMLLGMRLHHVLSEHHFALAVSFLLVVLGLLLIVFGGK